MKAEHLKLARLSSFHTRPERKNPICSKKLTWADGRIRNGLPGVFDGAFYYVDVYLHVFSWTDQTTHKIITGKHYTAVTPKQSIYIVDHLLANNYKMVQKADNSIYPLIAEKVASQMPELILWFDKMKSYNALLQFETEEINRLRTCWSHG